MDRRESIKSLVLGSLVGGLALESCVSDSKEKLTAKVWEHQYGKTPKEKAVDQKLLGEQFLIHTRLKQLRNWDISFYLLMKTEVF